MAELSVTFDENSLALKGELTRHTLMVVSDKSIKFLLKRASVLVDLQQVNLVDTAGLAWLFYLLEQAQSVKCQLIFANLPTKLDNLITLSGVEGFLPT